MSDLELGQLADPQKFISPIEVKDERLDDLVADLKMMYLIRLAEEKIADNVIEGKIKCPCHLAIGQEAVAVGIARVLRNTDRAFGTHRSHAHFISLGNSVESLFAEVLGKTTGCSRGMGGSMHLYGGGGNAFVGSVPIVAGTVSVATGAALSAKMDFDLKRSNKKNMDVAIAFFGDGAAEEGSVHECMNYASVFKLPMFFVCENNLFSSHLHINLRQPKDKVARYAVAHDMNHRVIDGNNIIDVIEASRFLVDQMRAGKGPGFLEAITYRWRGHVGPSEDIDVGLKRNDELSLWKKRDPVGRLHLGLLNYNAWSEKQFEEMKKECRSQIEIAWNNAESAPYPEKSQLLSAVYASGEAIL